MSHGEIPYIIDPDRLILDARLVYHSHEVSKVAAPGMAHQNLRLLWSCSHHLYPWPSGWSFQLLLEMEVRNDLGKYQFWSNATMMRPFKMKRTSIHIWFCPKPDWSKIVSNHLKSDFLIEIVLLRGIPYTIYPISTACFVVAPSAGWYPRRVPHSTNTRPPLPRLTIFAVFKTHSGLW